VKEAGENFSRRMLSGIFCWDVVACVLEVAVHSGEVAMKWMGLLVVLVIALSGGTAWGQYARPVRCDLAEAEKIKRAA
jgi:hypothetical protein